MLQYLVNKGQYFTDMFNWDLQMVTRRQHIKNNSFFSES